MRSWLPANLCRSDGVVVSTAATAASGGRPLTEPFNSIRSASRAASAEV